MWFRKDKKTIIIGTPEPSEHIKRMIERQLALNSTEYSKFKAEQLKREMSAQFSIKDTIEQLQYKD